MEEKKMETKLNPEELARLAYSEYGKTTNFKNYQGLPMPEFDDLPPKIREAWMAAASIVCDFAIGYVLEKLSQGIRDIETEIKDSYGQNASR